MLSGVDGVLFGFDVLGVMIMEDFNDKYRMNFFVKAYAQDYIKNPGRDTMLSLLAEIVVRIEDGCEALVPMVRDGERIQYDTVSDGQEVWIPMYTDWDEISKGAVAELTMSLPIRCIVEDAFESGKAEGIILNLHSEEVFLGKAELDWVLDVLMVRETER